MSKAFKILILSISFGVFLIGCSSSVRKVATYDEKYEAEMKARYNQLREDLNEEYKDNFSEMTKDEDFDEYVSLNARFGSGSSHLSYAEDLRNNFTGEVNLKNQTVQYQDTIIEYEQNENDITIINNDTDLLDDTFVRMVEKANADYEEVRTFNFRRILTTGWMPLLMFVIGLIAWVKPEWVWYLEGGFRYQDTEPTSTVLTFIRFQAIVAFGLMLLFIYLIFQGMI